MENVATDIQEIKTLDTEYPWYTVTAKETLRTTDLKYARIFMEKNKGSVIHYGKKAIEAYVKDGNPL